MDIHIRETRVIPTMMHWRKEMITNVLGTEPSRRLMAANRQYYIEHTDDGTHVAVIAEVDGTDAGCGAICLSDELPSPDNPSGRCACLMNIYVREEYRGRGVGSAIVRWLVERAWQSGCGKIWLETTEPARPLYHSAGFRDLTGYMKYEDNQP